MGNNTQKVPITKQAVYERLSDELDKMDKASDMAPLKVLKRGVIKLLGLKDIPKAQHKVYSGKHHSLLRRVEKMEAAMIKEGNK